MPIPIRPKMTIEEFMAIRHKLGMTQAALARHIGCSDSYVMKIENNKNKINPTLQSLMECLDELHTLKESSNHGR